MNPAPVSQGRATTLRQRTEAARPASRGRKEGSNAR